MTHVFISYSRTDNHFARLLKIELEQADIQTWIDTEKLLAGKDWRQAIDEAIHDAYALIIVMSPEAAASRYVTYEWAFALGLGIPVIPLMLKPTEFHTRLDMLQHFDFTNPDSVLQPWTKLIERIETIQEEYGTRIQIPHNAPRDIRQTLEAFNNWNPVERQAAAMALGNIENPIAVPALCTVLLKDKNPSVRASVAQALGQIKDTNAVTALSEALQKDRNARVRKAAAWALGQIKDVQAVPALSKALKDTKYYVRWAVAWALGQTGNVQAVPVLIEALKNDMDNDVKLFAQKSLQKIGTPEALTAVKQWKEQMQSQL